MGQSLLAGYLIEVHQVLDEGVVQRELFDHILAHKVRAGISNMRYRDARILNERGDNGCAHLLETFVLATKHYRSIRLLNRAFESFDDIASTIAGKRASHRVDADLRRELTPLGASHSIKNNEAVPCGCGYRREFILIHRALNSDVRGRGRNYRTVASTIGIFSPGFAQLNV
jgi:hypothetical protein